MKNCFVIRILLLENNKPMKQTLKYIYERFYEEVKYADTKHSISLTLASALAVFSATYLSDSTPVIVIISASSIIFSLISVLYSFCALYVKEYKTEKTKKIQRCDLLSYKTISKFGEEEFLSVLVKEYPFVKNYKPDNFDCDLAKQVIRSAKAIKHKFSLFNYSISFLLISLFCEAGMIVLKGVI